MTERRSVDRATHRTMLLVLLVVACLSVLISVQHIALTAAVAAASRAPNPCAEPWWAQLITPAVIGAVGSTLVALVGAIGALRASRATSTGPPSGPGKAQS